MSYLSKEMAIEAIASMAEFHRQLKSIYEQNQMDFLEDTGRRNILMSRPQEKFFATALSTRFPEAIADGRSGQPDILIPELDKELECKITSPHRSGGWSLQTDYGTLKRKGTIDYLYMLCDKEFEYFAVFHFENLTCRDFHSPSTGSRGKSPIIMGNAIDRCNILVGGIENRNILFLESILEKLNNPSLNPGKEKEKLLTRQEYWSAAPLSYSFKLESINGEHAPA